MNLGKHAQKPLAEGECPNEAARRNKVIVQMGGHRASTTEMGLS